MHAPLTLSTLFLTLVSAPVALGQEAVPWPERGPVGQGPVDAGPVELFTAELDDAVPVGRRPIAVPGADGDRLVGEQATNPHALGFVGGTYAPPPGERLDPTLRQDAASLTATASDGRPERAVYGFVLFDRRITAERTGELERLGVRMLGFHPEYASKVALPTDALDVVAALPFVRWVGAARPAQKIHPDLASRIARLEPGDEIALFVSLFESDLNHASVATPVGAPAAYDPSSGPTTRPTAETPGRIWRSHGWQEHALEQFGARIDEYLPRLDVVKLRVPVSQVAAIAARDFVLAVEAVVPTEWADDEGTPMMNLDIPRATYHGAASGEAMAGVIDSGMSISHEALASHYSYGWDVGSVGTGPWIDEDEHGTRSIGALLAAPPAGPNQGGRGIAHRLGFATDRRFRNVKAAGSTLSLPSLFAFMRSPLNDGSGNISPRPHVVNNSYGTAAGLPLPWIGTEANSRAVDDEVWAQDQVYVFAAHNHGPNPGTVSQEGSSKNALTVGNAMDFLDPAFGTGDPGNLEAISSRGPTGDGRFKPNVNAAGVWTRVPRAQTISTYVNGGGTSIAAPKVAGLVAQLSDHFSWLRYQPARVASLVMATATSKDDTAVSTPANAHLNDFGTGRIDGYRAHYGTSQMTFLNWGFPVTAGSWTYGDFPVAAGATRVIVVMHYVEPAPSAGAGKALVNDWDLYLDQPPVDPAGNTGEWFAHQSAVDNTEIRTLNNPIAGTWRWKAWPTSTTSSVKMSVTVQVIYGDTTPDGNLTLGASKQFVKPNESLDLTATVDNPSFVASAVYLDTQQTAAYALLSTRQVLKDGAVANLHPNSTGDPTQSGLDVVLGNVVHGTTRTVTWNVRWPLEGVKPWTVQARSDNWLDETKTLNVVVDGTKPQATVALDGGAIATDSSVVQMIIAATDNLSGVAQMRAKNDAGSWSPWVPYSTSWYWSLLSFGGATTKGTRTVTLEVMDNSGNVTSTADSIVHHDPIEPFGAACVGAAGTPIFTVSGVPALGHSLSFHLQNPPTSIGFLYLGLSKTNWGVVPLPYAIGGTPGCSLLISLDVLLYQGTPMSIGAPIPVDPVVVGLPLHFQWIFPTDPSGHVVTSRAATVIIAGS